MSAGNFYVQRLSRITSTNTYLKENFEAYKTKIPLALLADEQTVGRGRGGHGWFSLKDKGVYLSLLDRLSSQKIQLLSLRLGLLVIKTLEQAGCPRLQLKWPNDILRQGKKVAGILVENIFCQEECYSVMGIGINLLHCPEDFPEQLRAGAVSLKMIDPEFPADREQIVQTILENYQLYIHLIPDEKIIVFANEYSSVFKNRRVRLFCREREVSGIFEAIGSGGGIVLCGKPEIYHARDVRFDSIDEFL